MKALRRQTAGLAEHQLPVTAAVGVALFEGLTASEILAPAASPCTKPRKRGAEAERIQRALTDGRFELYCQPILDLASNVVSQYELLLRLRADDGRLLPPSAFLAQGFHIGVPRSIVETFGQPTPLSCYQALQNLRAPLHFDHGSTDEQ